MPRPRLLTTGRQPPGDMLGCGIPVHRERPGPQPAHRSSPESESPTLRAKTQTLVNQALLACRGYLLTAVGFSLFINLLMFVSPLYMLQVYDRVLTSRSNVTLLMITLVAMGLLVVYALLEMSRTQLLVRTGIKFDSLLSGNLFRTIFRGHLRNPGGAYSQALRDMDTLREFLTGSGIIVFCDAPWVPVYIAVCFIFHPYLGLLALVGAILIFALALSNELATKNLLKKGSVLSVAANSYATSSLRNAEVIHAMGMLESIHQRWEDRHHQTLACQARASDSAGLILASSKFVRIGLQVGVLGMGAYLAVENIISPGMMIAASIIMGKALAPVEMAVSQWKGFIAARSAYERLQEIFVNLPPEPERMPLPNPKGILGVESITVVPPGGRRPVLGNVSFALQPGEAVGIIGPSGAGKSSLARAVVGVWPIASGAVRLDGADLRHWDADRLGPHIGYLPQDVELFAGTVAENIARFGEVDPEAVVMAAQKAGVHEMILQLPNGYDSPIGEGGQALSGGQRQRVALARALYGNPVLLVLDEPNASLDAEGEQALTQALFNAKNSGCTIVVVSHRTALLSIVDKLLVLSAGILQMFGPRDAVLERLQNPAPAQPPPPPGPAAQVTPIRR